MMVVLVLFGGALSSGGLLVGLGWEAIAFAVLAIFVARPLAGWISLGGTGVEPAERAVVSFFGIRGIGSAYYLAHALREGTFVGAEALWSTLSLVVLVSIILHGSTVTPVMGYLDRRRPRSGEQGRAT
jgi:NhaP-type Na+/H+ or K+/H+ antiporter